MQTIELPTVASDCVSFGGEVFLTCDETELPPDIQAAIARFRDGATTVEERRAILASIRVPDEFRRTLDHPRYRCLDESQPGGSPIVCSHICNVTCKAYHPRDAAQARA